MPVNGRRPNFKKVQRRDRRSRTSPAHSSVQDQAQHTSDAHSRSAETTPSPLFNSALNNGGQLATVANVKHENVTINIQAMEGVAPQPRNSPQTTNSSRNMRRVLLPEPPGPVQRSNEIYERLLRVKKRGHPLWIPQANMVLPIPYRAQGVRVGDVGIFTENGGFDFLFNICVLINDPINPRKLPENFIPISPPVNPTDIRKFAEFRPGSYMTSSSVAESRTDESSDLIFESSASEGAILTMPEGAYSEDLGNFSRLGKYIATHAEDWYKFVNGPRGRDAQNGDLRVVVGCDKTTSWGMATFSHSSFSQETNLRLKFSVPGEQQSKRNAGNKYIWEHSGVASAEVRIGPGRGENEELGETSSNRLRNQCLFLRTLNVTLSEKVWKEIFPHVVAVADQNPHPGIHNQTTCSPHIINTGHSHPQPQSNSSQNVTPNLMSPFDHDVLDGAPCLSSMSLPEETGQSFDSSCNCVLHPSKMINQCLLKRFPHARVAVTHDRDWSSIIGMVSCHSDPTQLFSVVCSMTDIVLDNDTGLVFLELKEKNEKRASSEDLKAAGLIESIKNGRLTLDQYLFGLHDDRRLRLQDLRDMLRSGSTNRAIPMDSFLSAHPERPLSLDELLNVFEGDHHVHGSIDRQSITSMRAKLSLLPTRQAEQSSSLLRLGDALLRRFSQWAQKDDLEEAIWSYEEALSLIPNTHYHYLETLLGLCSSLFQRYYLLGHADDLNNLLLYLDLQCDILNHQRSDLATIEVRLYRPSPVLDVISLSQSPTFQFAPSSHNSVLYPVLDKDNLSYAYYPVPRHIFYHRNLYQILNFYWKQLKPNKFVSLPTGGLYALSLSFADSVTHSIFNANRLDLIQRCQQLRIFERPSPTKY